MRTVAQPARSHCGIHLIGRGYDQYSPPLSPTQWRPTNLHGTYLILIESHPRYPHRISWTPVDVRYLILSYRPLVINSHALSIYTYAAYSSTSLSISHELMMSTAPSEATQHLHHLPPGMYIFVHSERHPRKST